MYKWDFGLRYWYATWDIMARLRCPPGPPSWLVLVSAVGLEDVEMRWYSAHFLKGGRWYDLIHALDASHIV